jgi:prolyl oligopeptidase
MASFRVEYPAAQRLNLVEDLFGHQVPDPYRWLEDPASPQTAEWLAAEEALWDRYRGGLTDREAFAARVRELLQVGSVGLPAWRGTTQFYTRRDPDQEHAVLYVAGDAPGADATSAPDAGGAERALIDLIAIDPSGRTTLDAWQPDKEGRLLAYQLSHGGDEESLLRVLDVATGELVEGSPGCLAARRSTTYGGCRRTRSPRARRSTTGGCTCTRSGRRRSRTWRCSAPDATRPPTTGPASAWTAAG